MSHTPIPWVGLIALVAMFVIPFLPNWLFEGPQTRTHRPVRHICGDCGALWTDGHTCGPAVEEFLRPLVGELKRLESWNAGR